MTINIPLKAVAFVLYSLALLGGAFGISYAVFEWRDDDGAFDTAAIEERLDVLEQETSAGPTKAELDSQNCAAALEAAGNVQPTGVTIVRIVIPQEIQDALDRYCK